MPRLKTVHSGLKRLSIDLDKQRLPGTFEHALGYLLDHALDRSDFHARYRNGVDGAPAYATAVLLLTAVFGDSLPHYFTPLAAFVSSMGDLAAKLFAPVRAGCDRQGLIGREMFAIDGVKLPSSTDKTAAPRWRRPNRTMP